MEKDRISPAGFYLQWSDVLSSISGQELCSSCFRMLHIVCHNSKRSMQVWLMAWEAVHVTHAILLLVTWYLIHSIVLLSATLCHMVSMESVHISSQCLASWGYSWEKRTNGYSFGTRITFFDSCARFNVGSSIHTHLECAHILKSFMALRFPVLTGTSSIGWANDGVHNYFLFLGDAHLLRYSQTLGVVMFRFTSMFLWFLKY